MNQAWDGHPGMLVENVKLPLVSYSLHGAIVPSNDADDFDVKAPGDIGVGPPVFPRGPPDSRSTGLQNIRTGEPGDTCIIQVGPGIIGNGHVIDTVSMTFRYSVGYHIPAGPDPGKDPMVRVYLADLASGRELQTLGATGPLGNYSYDRFKTFSPEIPIAASGLGLPNDQPVAIMMEVTNNQRNLQIPIDDKANGWNIRVTWKATPFLATATDKNTNAKFAVNPPLAPYVPLSSFNEGQLWAKRLPGGRSAALFINHSPRALSYTLSMKKLNLTASTYTVRDVWAGTNNGTATAFLRLWVQSYDSAFVTLTPLPPGQGHVEGKVLI